MRSPDGELPVSLPTRDANGNLDGVTYVGGDSACGNVGSGVVYEVTPKGRERVLHAFSGGNDGALPWGPIYIDRAGELVGTTQEGGKFDLCSNGCGIVYERSPR